ncbi:DUF4198 domain-containing protein [Microvirga sp. STS02]|uniref:DUF4198 domain-containing protein n=1 Tax=Hymenobacter negativus TaxID=2795026 RepID=UPI0018DDE7D5|nr:MULTISPECIES: DUF4198 domain-containing protein [Bacteria]MBH8570935.1 DUF4198 domain-containing protein [Hymenobacter negativus]MBR7210673.1 DUF4198 domain-containing protein [Microvirga sp. STS02]
MHIRTIVLAAIGGLLATAALAHEFWLEAPRFRLQPGETVNVHTLIGADFKGEPWTTKAAKIQRLIRFGPNQADSTDLTPKSPTETDTFRTSFAFAQPGTHVVLLRSTNSFIELPADQFTAYLREEGLDYALKLRQENEEMAKPGRETYRRCAKTLIQVGEAAATAAATDSACRHIYGLPLELVPEQNPYRLAADKALTVRVLRAGRPAFGAAVQVWQRQPGGLPTTHYTTRANQNGRILLRLSGPGPYLLAAVDMSVAPAKLRAHADWQSTWASLTFAGPAAALRIPAKH